MEQNAFEIIGPITEIETIAVRSDIREVENLRELFGKGRWRKRKGVATVRFANATVFVAELHWYEAHGVGKRKMKIKKLIRKAP